MSRHPLVTGANVTGALVFFWCVHQALSSLCCSSDELHIIHYHWASHVPKPTIFSTVGHRRLIFQVIGANVTEAFGWLHDRLLPIKIAKFVDSHYNCLRGLIFKRPVAIYKKMVLKPLSHPKWDQGISVEIWASHECDIRSKFVCYLWDHICCGHICVEAHADNSSKIIQMPFLPKICLGCLKHIVRWFRDSM